MLVRVRSKDGIFRIQVETTDDAGVLIDKTLETTENADPATLTFSNQPRGGEMPAETLRGKTLGELGIAHGHLLYAAYQTKEGADADVSNGVAPSVLTSATPVSAATDASSASQTSAKPDNAVPAAAGKGKQPNAWENVKEDAVDVYLEKQDGKILRPKDAKLCRHGDKAMCDYCMPLEPYDATYHAEHKIKHLSFHAYLRQKDVLTNSTKGSSYIPPLDPASYQVQIPCPSGSHPAWPAGICTKCQPSAITLLRQNYRMVDHVEFASASLVENLLGFWRKTGQQRFGFLLGRYEPYTVTNEATEVAAGGAGATGKKIAGVPLGIKAVVEAIHEPPQEGDIDGLTLGIPWDDQARVEALAKKCVVQAEGFAKGLGCEFLGMIYTDLTPADPTFEDKSLVGKVLPKRNKDSFFLSGNEVTFAAHVQLANRSPSRFSRTGFFNSKFVTCVLSGTAPGAADPADEESGVADQVEWGAIDVRAYQVSEQAMALVQADLVEASVKPNVMRLKQSADKERYVPEVFYRYKNQYNIEVKESAKPTFPVEYLLVNVTHGFPNKPSPLFLSSEFPIENRPGLHDQSTDRALAIISKALQGAELHPLGATDAKGKGKGKADDGTAEVRMRLVKALSDWHLFAFLSTCGLLEQTDMDVLAKVVTSHDPGSALDDLLRTPGWQTLTAIAREQGSGSGGGGAGGYGGINDDEDADLAAAIRASMAGVSGPDTGGQSPPRRAEPAPAAAPASPPIRSIPQATSGNAEPDPFMYDGAEDFEIDGDDDDVFHDQDDNDDDDVSMVASRRLARDDSDVQISEVRQAPTSASATSTNRAQAAAGRPGARAEDAILVDDDEDVYASAGSSTQMHGASGSAPAGGQDDGVKVCPHCTFHNARGASDCDVCGLPI